MPEISEVYHIWFYAVLGFWIPSDLALSQGEAAVSGNVFPLKLSEEHALGLGLGSISAVLTGSLCLKPAEFTFHCAGSSTHTSSPLQPCRRPLSSPLTAQLPEARENWAIVSWGFL